MLPFRKAGENPRADQPPGGIALFTNTSAVSVPAQRANTVFHTSQPISNSQIHNNTVLNGVSVSQNNGATNHYQSAGNDNSHSAAPSRPAASPFSFNSPLMQPGFIANQSRPPLQSFQPAVPIAIPIFEQVGNENGDHQSGPMYRRPNNNTNSKISLQQHALQTVEFSNSRNQIATVEISSSSVTKQHRVSRSSYCPLIIAIIGIAIMCFKTPLAFVTGCFFVAVALSLQQKLKHNKNIVEQYERGEFDTTKYNAQFPGIG